MQNVFLGRQPILDAEERTHGYELLFRSTETNAYDPSMDGDCATARVLINSVMELGLERIVGEGLAFINLTDRFIASPQLLECLPPGRVVLEVLESVIATPSVLEGIARLKDLGYTIALDDFVRHEGNEALLALADLIKYDITDHAMADLERQVAEDRRCGRATLAERVETPEQFHRLREMGFEYFQGYHFARPTILRGATLKSDKLGLVQLLSLVNDPDTESEVLIEAVSRDVSLSVRALRFVNSAAGGLKREVSSIQQALALLGRETLRNWITLLVMSQDEDKPGELITMALVRARFCQLMAVHQHESDPAEQFTIGLLSLLDVLMDTAMETVLDSISASGRCRETLLDGKGDTALMLAAARHLESGVGAEGASADVQLDQHMLQAFQDSLIWTEEIRRNLAFA